MRGQREIRDPSDVVMAPGPRAAPDRWLEAAGAAPPGRPEEAYGYPEHTFLLSLLLSGAVLIGSLTYVVSTRSAPSGAGLLLGVAAGVVVWLIGVPLVIMPRLTGRATSFWASLLAVVPAVVVGTTFRRLAHGQDVDLEHLGFLALLGAVAGVFASNAATILWIRLRWRAFRRRART